MGRAARAKKAKRKEAWFDRGARAIARFFPPDPDAPSRYLCPLCCQWYTELCQVTFDHVPPAALGGRELALTCAQCNKTAGARVDHEMLALERAIDFGQGTLVHPTRGHLRVGEHMVYTNVRAVGEEVELTVVPAANRPDIERLVAAEFSDQRDESQWGGLALTIGLDQGFHYRPALVGWLRATYLVAFAAIGYRYVLHPKLVPVRRQLADATAAYLGIFSGTVREARPDERRLLLVNEPTPFRSLLVQMGRHLVFLPRWDDEGDLYQRLATELTPGQLRASGFTGIPLPWPQAPTHTADLPTAVVE